MLRSVRRLFGVSPELVQGLIAGGNGAVRAAKEGQRITEQQL